MTNEEVLSVAAIVERATNRFHQQAADHEAKMVEHRASFGARTEADAKIIAGLREELDRIRNSLGIQAAKEANKVLGMVEGEGLRGAAERVVKERDGLLTQVQDMRAELERLKKPAPEAAPVLVVRPDVYHGPCASTIEWTEEATHDTPAGRASAESAVKVEPKPGDTVRLVKLPTPDDYCIAWEDEWGTAGAVGTVIKRRVATLGPVAVVEIRDGIEFEWPLSCVEVVRIAGREVTT